jgi:general secretion pathway protein K
MVRPCNRLLIPSQQGFALVWVLGALVLMTLIASQLAVRVESLRGHTQAVQLQIEAERKMSEALSVALYFLLTNPGGPAGFGTGPESSLIVDGRAYALPSGARVAVVDQRGLLSLTAFDRQVMARVIARRVPSPAEQDALIDILLDYQDTDSLRRLNGAEAPEYAALGLPSPRNDWLVSVRELARMPLWRDRPQDVEIYESMFSARRSGFLNPNLMALELVAAFFPWASREQLALFDSLRRDHPFVSGKIASALSGLPLDSDNFIFHTSDEFAVTVWAPGAPRALRVQVALRAENRVTPWQVVESHAVAPEPLSGVSVVPFPSPTGIHAR